ncbi:MAG: hypothetical protein ACT4QC_23805 [Planctomycetaceae bacterium]
MSCLKLHWPHPLSLYPPTDADRSDEPGNGEEAPVILRFPRSATRYNAASRASLLSRARLIHQNRCCPICGRASVVPVDSQPALMTRNQMPIPGMGVLVGFECDACGHAWAADH